MPSKKGVEAGRAYIKAYWDDSAVSRGMKRMQRSIVSVSESIGSIGKRFIWIGAAIASLFAAPLRRAAMLQMMEADLAALLGSTKKAKQALKDWRKFAADTPLEFIDVAELGKQLLNWKLATEKTVVDVLRQIGDASGGIPDRMASVIKALGQMRATGRIQADEMNQLTEAGLPAWELLAKVLGTDVAGAMEMVTKRQVDAAKAVPELIKALGKFGNGRMAAMAKTLTGQLSALRDALWETVTPLGEALLPYAGRFVTIIADLVSRVGEWIKANASIAVKIAATSVALVTLGSVLVTLSAGMRLLTFAVAGLAQLIQFALLPAMVLVTTATKTATAVTVGFSVTVRAMAATVAAAAGSMRAMALVATILQATLSAAAIAVTYFRSTAVGTAIALRVAVAATAAFNLSMRAAAVTATLFGGALRLLGVSAAVLGGIFAALGSPLGAVLIAIAAVGGAIYFAMQQSITFGDVLNWLKERFGSLAKTTMEVFGVIHDAMMAGDMATAAKVLWASIQLAFAHGIKWIRSAWLDMTTWIASVFIDIAAQIESVWANMSEAIVRGLATAAQKAFGIMAAIAEKLGMDDYADQFNMMSAAAEIAAAGADGKAKEVEELRKATQKTLQEDAARQQKALERSTEDEEAALKKAMDEAKKTLHSPVAAPKPSAEPEVPETPASPGIKQSTAINEARFVGSKAASDAIAKALAGSKISADGKHLGGKLDEINKSIKETKPDKKVVV